MNSNDDRKTMRIPKPKKVGLLRRQTDAQSMVNQVIVTVWVFVGLVLVDFNTCHSKLLPCQIKICATSVLVNASQARTGIMIVLQGLNIDALLPAVNLI